MSERKTTTTRTTAPRRAVKPVKPELIDETRIAARAYERFLQRGGQHGHDVEDWLAAERELRR